ncbi:MAG: hypothetical protein GY760_09995 [Deltaproteobacteria bacterium]|nr:hypothetical protein [Deltaproteobacteria bacterium]
MLCEHLKEIEEEIIKNDYTETFRGKSWTDNCREWVYFDVVLDLKKLNENFKLNPCIEFHENTDPRSGLEKGLFCSKCQDGIMGNISGEETFPA